MKVELTSITKSFGSVLANDNISLTVEAGSIHGLLGENGAGKSTLVKILSGFIARDRGSILLNNIPVEIKNPQDAIARGIGMLHQDPLDFPALSVWENFTIGRLTSGFKKTEFLTTNRTKNKVFLSKNAAALELKQLADRLNFKLEIDEKVGNLSVGERQQLELLRLLSLGVETLILDEPTTGISASQKDALFAAAKQLAAGGKSVIFVSHKLEDVDLLCDRATVMRQGRVAGNVEIPCPSNKLVEMMFDRELAQPNKPPTARSDVALNLHNITIKDERFSIKIDSLNLQRGEVIGLAGLEGSGQRLLLLLCAGLLPASSGTIIINGANMTRKSYQEYLQAGVGILPADRLKEGLVSGLSIREHVALRSPNKSFFVNWKDTLTMTQQRSLFSTFAVLPTAKSNACRGETSSGLN